MIKRANPGDRRQLDEQNCNDRTESPAARGHQGHPGHAQGQNEHENILPTVGELSWDIGLARQKVGNREFGSVEQTAPLQGHNHSTCYQAKDER